jgi:hypothetical protein
VAQRQQATLRVVEPCKEVLEPPRCCRLGAQVALALSLLHRKQHRGANRPLKVCKKELHKLAVAIAHKRRPLNSVKGLLEQLDGLHVPRHGAHQPTRNVGHLGAPSLRVRKARWQLQRALRRLTLRLGKVGGDKARGALLGRAPARRAAHADAAHWGQVARHVSARTSRCTALRSRGCSTSRCKHSPPRATRCAERPRSARPPRAT